MVLMETTEIWKKNAHFSHTSLLPLFCSLAPFPAVFLTLHFSFTILRKFLSLFYPLLFPVPFPLFDSCPFRSLSPLSLDECCCSDDLGFQ